MTAVRWGVFVIDGTTRSFVQKIELPQSLGIAYNSRTNRIYVSSAHFGNVHVIDAATRTLISSIDIGRHALELAVDEGRNLIYAASQTTPCSVVVIDGATNTVRGISPVGACPFGVAYNPTNDRVYVSVQESGTVWVLDASKLPQFRERIACVTTERQTVLRLRA